MACTDKPIIGTGKLLIGKDGKLLIQGDDKVASSFPSESHKLVTQKNADGTSSIYMIPSGGANKGKYFLVKPKEDLTLKKVGNNLKINEDPNTLKSKVFSSSSETINGNTGSQSMSKVLKNIATHISSVSSLPNDRRFNNVENLTNSSKSLADMNTETIVPSVTANSYVLTGTHQDVSVTKSNNMPSAAQSASNIGLVASGIAGNDFGNKSTVNTIPISPLLSLPSLPSSQQVIILTSGSTPVLPLTSTAQQPLSTAPLLQPLVNQTPQTPAVTPYQHMPNILIPTRSQSSTLATIATSYQTTITTATETVTSASSPYVPLIPILINTNQTANTSAPNFLQNVSTSVPTSSNTLCPGLMSQTSTTYSPQFLQTPLTAVSTSSETLSPVKIAPKPTMVPTVSNIKQTLTATNQPLLLTAQQAAILLSTASPPGTEIPSNDSVSTSNKMENVQVKTIPVSISSKENSVDGIQGVRESVELPKISHNSDLTTTAISTFSKSISEVPSLETYVQDGKIFTPVLKTFDFNSVITSNKPQILSNAQVLTCTASDKCSAPTIKTASTKDAGRPHVTQPVVSNLKHETESRSGVTPMLLFSHSAARNLKPNGLPDPFPEQDCQIISVEDSTTKPSIQDAVQQQSPPVLDLRSEEHSYTKGIENATNALPMKSRVVNVPLSKDNPLSQRSLNSRQSTISSSTVTAPRISTSSVAAKLSTANISFINSPSPQSVNSGQSTVSLSAVTSSCMSTSCNVSSSTATKISTTNINSISSSNIKVIKFRPNILPKTGGNLNHRVLSIPYAKTVVTSAGNTGSTIASNVTISSNELSVLRYMLKGQNGGKCVNVQGKPKLLITTVKPENSPMGNLVSIVPGNSAKYPSMTSLLPTSSHKNTRVVSTMNGNNLKDYPNLDLNLSRVAEKDKNTAELNGTGPPSKMSTADELPIRIDSVFSLSSCDQKPEILNAAECDVSGATESMRNTADLTNTEDRSTWDKELRSNPSSSSTASSMDFVKVDSFDRDGTNINSIAKPKENDFNPERSPTSSGSSMGQILREFDHLSNFTGVVLPDEAITESKIFSPCYVVLETLHMHAGKMKGINTRCSKTCRQKFLLKKSNIRLAIKKKVEANRAATVPEKMESQKIKKAKKRKEAKNKEDAMTSGQALSSSSINTENSKIKRSRDILHAVLDTAKNAAVQSKDDVMKTIRTNKEKSTASSNLSLERKDETLTSVKTITSQSTPVTETKKGQSTEKFYLIRVDGKTVLIPCINTVNQPKAFIVNDEKFDLSSYTVNKSSVQINTSNPNAIVLPRVSTTPSSTAASSVNTSVTSSVNTSVTSSVNTSVVQTSTNPAPAPTKTQVKVKQEPTTFGYGDETKTDSAPPVVIKKERMDRGYSDEPPKLERMDIKPSKRTLHELKSKGNAAPDLTAEEVVPPKKQKVLSKEERISSLKELLKKQEKDLEEIKKRRVAETTPVDLDL